MQKKMWFWLALTAGAWTIIIGWIQYWKYQAFGYNGLDLGIYSQVVWSLANGHGFASSIHDPSYLGDHLEFWLIPLAAIYKLWSSPLTLLWAQTLVLASSVFPLALLARRYLNTRHVWWVVGLWLAHPFLYNAAVYEFHGLVFALPFGLWSIWFYQRQRYGWWLISLAALLLVREDMPLLVFGWGIYAALERRSWKWWLVPMLVAIPWFFGAQAVIRAANPLDSYKYLAFYGWLGKTPVEMATYPFRHPLLFLSHVFSLQNWQTVIGVVLTFGFLPLIAWRRLLPVMLLFVQLLLLGAASDSIFRLHYLIPYLPFLAWAAIAGWQRIRDGQIRFRWFDQQVTVLLLGILAVLAPFYGQLLYGIAEWPWTPRPFASPAEAHVLQRAVDRVRPDERVLTTFRLLPALANREHVYSLNYVHLGRRQYTEEGYAVPGPIDVALIDWQQVYDYQFLYKTTEFEGITGPQRLRNLLAERNLSLERWDDGVAMYRRDGELEFMPTEPGELQAPAAKSIELVESSVFSQKQNPLVIEVVLRWRTAKIFEQPLSIRFDVTQAGASIRTTTQLLGLGGLPSNEWDPSNEWITTYQILTPTGSQPREVQIEVYALDGRMRLDRWRSFSPVVKPTEPLLAANLGQVSLEK